MLHEFVANLTARQPQLFGGGGPPAPPPKPPATGASDGAAGAAGALAHLDCGLPMGGRASASIGGRARDRWVLLGLALASARAAA